MSSGSSGLDRIRRECLHRGALWEDPDFEAANRSLFYTGYPLSQPVVWLRPREITRQYGMKPTLFADYQEMRFSLIQGQLGDCWLVASLASLAIEGRDMIHRVLPVDQNFSKMDGYCGAFRVNFWRFGRWVEVLVDDRLPTINGQLVFIHSSERNEFWGSIVEKAYAKLNGCFEALRSGLMGDAMDDLSGGITEFFIFKMADSVPADLVRLMFKSSEKHALIGTGIDGDGQAKKMPNGLVKGHAYTVVDLRQLHVQSSGGADLTLIKVRNPWGNAVEWNGAWSDGSQQWNQLSATQRQELGLVLRDDGEFWMDWADYRRNFSSLHICHLPPNLAPRRIPAEKTSGVPRGPASHWTVAEFRGRWLRDRTDGGRPILQETFWRNPQFRFQLYSCSHPGDPSPDSTSCIIGLQQRDIRRELPQGARYLSIGFVVYRLTQGKRYPDPIPRSWFEKHQQYLASVYFFTAARSNVRSFEFPPGEYLVVPCTYDSGQSGDFLLRIYMEKGSYRTEEGIWKGGLPTSVGSGSTEGAISPPAAPAPAAAPAPPFPTQSALNTVHNRNASAVSTSSRGREVQFDDQVDGRAGTYTVPSRSTATATAANRRSIRSTSRDRRMNGYISGGAEQASAATNNGNGNGNGIPVPVTHAAPAPASPVTPLAVPASGGGGGGTPNFIPESELRREFQKIAGQNTTLDAWQLQKLANTLLSHEPNRRTLDLSSCRGLVSLVVTDSGSNGGVSFHEFMYLWTHITGWSREFSDLDTNNSGRVPCPASLSQVLPRLQGLQLSNKLLEQLRRRFADARNELGFSEFVTAMAAAITAAVLFKKHEHLGVAMLNQEEFMNSCFAV